MWLFYNGSRWLNLAREPIWATPLTSQAGDEGTALTLTRTVLQTGKYYYRVCALDNAGNVSPGATASNKPTGKPILPAINLLLD